MHVRALTIYQPWASLIADGVKEYETRGWGQKFGYPYERTIAIHADERPVDEDEIAGILTAVRRTARPLSELPLGAIVAIVKVRRVAEIGLDRSQYRSQERLLGDWTPGRFAWQLEIVRRLRAPIPEVGQQGLWDWREFSEVRALLAIGDPSEDPGPFFAR